ncbi:MAG: Holliday junction resolvase RuvX [Sedimentisphaerales bacterium]
MRFLCIDLGDKRTGLAVCDDAEIIASPIGVVEGRGDLYNKITEAVKQYQPQALVFGLPLNMDGSEGDRAQAVRKFAVQLAEKITLPVFFQDERLSSFTAQGRLSQTGLTHKKKKGKIDAIAAAEILKEFITARGKNK